MANAIVGTLILTGLGALFAIPVGIISGIYMADMPGTPLRVGRPVRRRHAERRALDRDRRVRLRPRGAAVQAVLARLPAGVALGIMMIPIITRTTEELLLLVPETLREGALALGATRARAVFTVVLPAALPGIMTGIVLALARIAGETAPLLFTVVQQPLLQHEPRPADLVADRAGVHVRDLARTRTGTGRRGPARSCSSRSCSSARCSPGSPRGGSRGCTSGGDVTFVVSGVSG